jgi:hypothetical protein
LARQQDREPPKSEIRLQLILRTIPVEYLLFAANRLFLGVVVAYHQASYFAGALSAVSLMLVLALHSCTREPLDITSRSLSVFSDFTFVGAVSNEMLKSKSANIVTETLPKHGTAELPLPDRLEIGIQYIFHHISPTEDEELALVIFPARLRSAGVDIIKRPKTNRDLMYLYIGGPAFTISIREGDHEGLIYNQIDPELLKSSSEWAEEDYILLWLK